MHNPSRDPCDVSSINPTVFALGKAGNAQTGPLLFLYTLAEEDQ